MLQSLTLTKKHIRMQRQIVITTVSSEVYPLPFSVLILENFRLILSLPFKIFPIRLKCPNLLLAQLLVTIV